MKAQLKRELLTQKTFDSGALGILCSVVHQFARPGRYEGLVLKNGTPAGEFNFLVADDAEAMQLDFDLAQIGKTHIHDDKCNCAEKSARIVSPKGYVLFYSSSGDGYSVKVGAAGSQAPEFDSTRLDKGDLFALSLFEPTTYSMTNKETKAKGQITVSFSSADAKRLSTLETVYVEVEEAKFNPAEIKLVSTQGLVFRINYRARIVIQKTGSAETDKSETRRLTWKKPMSRKEK